MTKAGRRSARRTQHGVVILDALIAIFVATALMVPSVSVLMSASSTADGAKQNVIAYSAARQIVENLRVFKAAKLPVGTYTDATAFGAVPQLGLLNNATASFTITQTGNALRQAAITVSWRAGERSLPKSRVLVALFAKDGVAP